MFYFLGVDALRRRPRAAGRARSPLAPFFQALEESNGRAGKIETLAQEILEEPLIAEMQALRLIGEQNKCRRRSGCLRDVVDFHAACGRRSSAVEIHFLQPAVQLTR